jgi:hypothetical protein
MAIRRALQQLVKTGVPSEVHLHARCEIGATGAVGTTHGRYLTFARTGAGVYTVTVDNVGGLIDYLWADAKVLGGTANLRPRCAVNASTGVITVTVEATDGTTDTDPADGTSLCVSIVVVNSTVNY